ncbi:MAG: IS200/IS605 family transposase [Gemmatimonadetes bacterium]|nr:MAG: IS200/IS605 family transposase [Gemmatimonadota bacterium]
MAPGSVYPKGLGVSKAGHRSFALFAHVTWHTSRREHSVRQTDVATVTRALLECAARNSVHVLAQAVMADHVHVLVSFRPDLSLMPFIRDAKSESARRVNGPHRRRLTWARGYFAGSVSHSHIPTVRAYLARQPLRHPDSVPA